MNRFKLLVVIGLATSLVVACGKSEEQKAAEKAAEETKEAAEALKKAAENTGAAGAAAGLQEFAKAMEGAAAAMSGNKDGKAVEPVSFQTLQGALPDVSGWQRGEPTGERMTAPIAFSQTEADYTMGDATVNVKIVDSAFSQMMIAPWAMFLAAGYEKQTGDGYEKSVNIAGNPGFEKWSKGGKDGELNLVVAKRFLVTIDGNNINDTKVLHDFASKIDAGKLAVAK
jgi:hypothetical protein